MPSPDGENVHNVVDKLQVKSWVEQVAYIRHSNVLPLMRAMVPAVAAEQTGAVVALRSRIPPLTSIVPDGLATIDVVPEVMRSPLLLPVIATPFTVRLVAEMLVAVRRLAALFQVRPVLASKLPEVLYWI